MAWWIAFFALPAIYLSLFLRSLWRIGDEGSIVHSAQRVAEGELPYRDFFDVMGPGTYYWLALWFKTLGTSWLASRLAVLTTALLAAYAIYRLSTRIIPRRFALLPALIYTALSLPLWPGANHHFDSNTWALLAVAAYARGRADHVGPGFSLATPAVRFDRRWMAIAGVLAGATATVIPQKGVLVLLALLVSTLWEGMRQRDWKAARGAAVSLVAAFGAVGLSVVAFYYAQGALSDLVYAMAVWPATQYHAVNVVPYGYGLRELFGASWRTIFEAAFGWPGAAFAVGIVAAPLAFVFLLPVFGVVAGVQHALRYVRTGTGGGSSIPALYWCAGPALFVAECHRLDMTHLVYGSPVMLILATHWLTQSGTGGTITLHVVRACTLALALFNGIVAIQPAMTMDTRAGHVWMMQRDEALEFLQTQVRAGGTAFVYPYYPMYYFLANVRNPTRYSILMYHINTPAQFSEVIAALDTQRVQYVLWDTVVAGKNLSRWFPGYVDPPEESQELERYLRTHYDEISIKNGFRILKRHE